MHKNEELTKFYIILEISYDCVSLTINLIQINLRKNLLSDIVRIAINVLTYFRNENWYSHYDTTIIDV